MFSKRITADTVENTFKVVAWIAWLSPALYVHLISSYSHTMWYIWLVIPMILIHCSSYFLYGCISGDYLADKINNLRLPRWEKKKTEPKPTLDRQGLFMWLQYYALYPFICRNPNHKYIKAIPMHRADLYSLILFCAVLIIIIGVL